MPYIVTWLKYAHLFNCQEWKHLQVSWKWTKRIDFEIEKIQHKVSSSVLDSHAFWPLITFRTTVKEQNNYAIMDPTFCGFHNNLVGLFPWECQNQILHAFISHVFWPLITFRTTAKVRNNDATIYTGGLNFLVASSQILNWGLFLFFIFYFLFFTIQC